MSSKSMPSSRYQSKVLQFVAQQSMKLRDRARKSVRQLKLAATWGTQMVLYPFYAIFQSARLVGKQLEQTARQVFPKLTAALDPDSSSTPLTNSANASNPHQPLLPPQSDRPIETILDILTTALHQSSTISQERKAEGRRQKAEGGGKAEGRRQKAEGDHTTLQLLHSPTPPLPSSPTPPLLNAPPSDGPYASSDSAPLPPSLPASIQGIATLLSEKQLVLVDADNTTHNVLTLQQQSALQQRIVLEVAEYWRDRREFLVLEGASNSPLGRRFLPLPKERDTMLPPVRYLRRFIAWMQTSPVAIATNVFQESALVPTRQAHNPALDMAQMLGLNRANAAAFLPLEPSPKAVFPVSPTDNGAIAAMELTPLYPDVSSPEFPNNSLNRFNASLAQLNGRLVPPSGPFPAAATASSNNAPAVPLSPKAIKGKRLSWWTKLLDRIIPIPPAPASIPSSASPPSSMPMPSPGSLFNRQTPSLADMPKPWLSPTMPQDLTRNLWFDPDSKGSEVGWMNANQINQVRRQREFPPIVPSLPARVSLNLQSTALNASYASIEANLTEMTEAGLITTQIPNTIHEADLSPDNPFPESAAAMLNGSGATPDPVSLETYLAHHGAAYDFRHTEDPTVDRDVLYRVSADAETSVHSESGAFPLDIPGQPRADISNTWIDIPVEVVGYDKHPLERLLGWIDLGMVWIERRIASVWYWVCDRF